jgi:adenosylmethionine-8-amino-7-oxononanoate aminotransferase
MRWATPSMLRRRLGGRDRAEDEFSLLAQRRLLADKQEFVCLQGSYHGETIGALAVTDVALFKDAYGPLLRAPTVASPDARNAVEGESAQDVARAPIKDVERCSPSAPTRSPPSSSSRWCSAPPAWRCTIRSTWNCCATVRPPPRAPDRRRDRGRLRPHRHLLRLRAGRHLAGLPVPVEGHQRRLPAAVAGAQHRRRSTRPSTAKTSRAASCTRTPTPATPLACRAALATLQIFREDDVLNRNRELATA